MLDVLFDFRRQIALARNGPPGTARISRNETVNTTHSVTTIASSRRTMKPDHRQLPMYSLGCGAFMSTLVVDPDRVQRVHVLQVVVEAADVRLHHVLAKRRSRSG